MLFPESERVIYRKNQLVQVICEVRFPEILRIESEAPSGFQDRIRSAYPLTEKSSGFKLGLPSEIAKALPIRFDIGGGSDVYNFSSRDKSWTVSLTSGTLSLSTVAYHKWEDFKAHFGSPLDALATVYCPAFFSRVGLRYRNIIRPRDLGLEGVGLAELLQPHIAGVWSEPAMSDSIEGATQQLVFRLPQEAGKVRVTHGLAKQGSGDNERLYAVDIDLFVETPTEVKDAIQKLDFFNAVAARTFRWCISDKLHTAMEPHLE